MSTTTSYSQLEEELQNSLDGEVSFENDYRALYATDSSNYRQLPVGVVFPKNKQDIIKTVSLCRKHNLHILTRGGGTSLAGQCCNTGLIMDFSKYYNKIIDIDPEKKTARIQTGLVLDDLNRALEGHGLIFGPDPSTHNHCTLGGMMGNNSCGIHSVMAQVEDGGVRTSDFVESAEILTYSGEKFEVGPNTEEELQEIISKADEKGKIYGRLRNLRNKYAEDIRKGIPDIPRRVSGYNLDDLLPENNFNVARSLVGTECTCTIFLEATVRLINRPNKRSLVLLGYNDIFEAGDHVTEIMDHKPIGLEGMDNKLVNYMHKKELHEEDLGLLPDGNGWLLVEFGGESKEKADEKAKKMMADLKKNANGNTPSMKLYDDPDEESRVWEIRESGLGATAFVQGLPDMWPGWEDSAVAPEKVGDYLRDLRELFQKYDYHPSVYGHFGQGCIHCRVGFDLKSKTGIETYKKFVKEAADLVVSYGGSLSGEHGDGQARGPLLERMYGKKLMQAFHEFKEIWDPDWKMNPGKVIDPLPLDSDLRYGKNFRPGEHDETHFKYPKDKGSFHRATMRCVGVGECRKTNSGTMCPSYMVTRDEKQVTRGRAHLLWEMMQGKEIEGGWKSKKVKESLDLCLACKGCLSECPVSVDMATYKAEYFSHYYKNRIRPRSAYAFGIIDKYAQVASRFSDLTNFLTHSKITAPAFKKIGGIAQEREVPEFAKKPFTRSSEYDEKFTNLENTVMLWPDTFNNYFFPKVLDSAANILESAGFEVIVPERHYCCGRPLYDFGMLDMAKSYLQKILNGLSFFIQEDVPIIGLEASCIAVFRDELGNLFPNDNNAKRLQKNFKTLPEFIMEHEDRFKFKNLNTSALMHKHCHHNAVMGYDPDLKVLKKIGVDVNVPDAGCCGLAGSFGFEEGDKYEVSVKEGERVIWPAVRDMDDKYLITDGFSCREQIKHGTGKLPLHTAELIEKALIENKRKNKMNMKRKVVVITGASAGVGRAIAKEFAKQEAKILLVARGKDGLEGTKKEVEQLGGEAWIYEADVADADAVHAAADYAEKNIGPIDIWINNAMVSVFSMAKDMKPEEYKRVTEVTYLGQVYGTLAAIEKMKERNCGKIILIGSALAYRGIPLQSAYCGSKHAIQGFFESVRAELLHDGINIDLSIVHLPAMNTTQFGWVKSRFDKKPRPMGKIFQPEVAARAVVEVAESGERLRMVGFSTVQTVWGNKLAPDFLDHFMAENGVSGQLTDEPEDPNRQDNLWEPVPGDQGSHGEFDKKAQNYSIYDKLYENRKSLALVGGTIIGGALFKMLFGR
ncbi:FAD-binding oxidoreductase [Christiangramia fulva]|uniref:FAD-binding oxidoreductase n=1 Tax=Christiangramia fulva TaxID=2126553 RepID=A0A2R3Z8M4_9FLAO|nr:SDR family oxidoreductase [Christiangramia fulva]AVR46627.1 FAD-binding oxidoreductase [Christiangramia fulva]